MLPTILVSVFAFALLMGFMALGVMVTGKRLRGSCGGNPDSAHCTCSPEKQAACRSKAEMHSHDEEDIFAGPVVTEETLAPPGEERLIQLRTGRR